MAESFCQKLLPHQVKIGTQNFTLAANYGYFVVTIELMSYI